MVETINALGGLAGLAALITAFAGFRNVKRDTQAIRAAPDNLSEKLDNIAEQVRQLSASSTTMHEQFARRLDGHDREIRDMRRGRSRP